MQCYVYGAVDLPSALNLRPDIASWATVVTVLSNGVMCFDSAATQAKWSPPNE